jgi:hypothetical protein
VCGDSATEGPGIFLGHVKSISQLWPECWCPCKVPVETITSMMALSGHEGGALRSGISDFPKRLQKPALLLPPWEDKARRKSL